MSEPADEIKNLRAALKEIREIADKAGGTCWCGGGRNNTVPCGHRPSKNEALERVVTICDAMRER